MKIENPERGRKLFNGMRCHAVLSSNHLKIENPERGRKPFALFNASLSKYDLKIENPERGRKLI